MKYMCVEVPETKVVLLNVDDERRSHVLSLSEAEALANTLLEMVAHLTMRAADGGTTEALVEEIIVFVQKWITDPVGNHEQLAGFLRERLRR